MSLKRRTLLILLSIVLASLVYVVSHFWIWYGEWNEYHAHKDEIRKTLDSIEGTPPKGGSQKAWSGLCSWGHAAVANALFTPDSAPVSEVIRLKQEFRQKLDRETEVTPQTMVWFWERLGQCSPAARRYTTKFRPSFDGALDVVQEEYDKRDE